MSGARIMRRWLEVGPFMGMGLLVGLGWVGLKGGWWRPVVGARRRMTVGGWAKW